MITLKVEELALKYRKLVDRFRKAQDKGKIKERLDNIFKTFLEEKYFENPKNQNPFYIGIHPEKVRYVESNAQNTIDILFEHDISFLSPWIHAQFVNDFREVLIRGGPGIHNYLLEDDHCSPAEWKHVFYPQKDLDSALLTLADMKCFIREKEVQPYELAVTIDGKVISMRSKFPRSSATRTNSIEYPTEIDFEIREEISPLNYMATLFSFLRTNPNRGNNIEEFSKPYIVDVDVSKLNPEDYKQKNKIIDL